MPKNIDDSKFPIVGRILDSDVLFINQNGTVYHLHMPFFLNYIKEKLGIIESVAEYVIYTDPLSGLKIRTGVRIDQYVVDKELIIGGFSGDENIGWENISGTV